MDLLEKLINVYETNEELSVDEILAYVQKEDKDYSSLTKEEAIQLKRDFLKYINASEEQCLLENKRERKGVPEAEVSILRNTYTLSRERRRPHKRYVEAFVNNISVAKTLDEMYEYYFDGNDAQMLISQINDTGTTNWTVPRWAKRGDIVLFMHSKTANSTLTKLRTTLRSSYPPNSNKAKQLEQLITNQLAFHKIYGGKIFALGRINGKPKKEDIASTLHFKSRYFCDIDDLFLLTDPVDISEFNSFIKISQQSAVTAVFGSAYEELKHIISMKNAVPEYFEYSYSTPFPHSLVNRENWMKLGLEYRNSFTLEIQFRQCYVDYLLQAVGDQRTIYMECGCYKGTNSVTFVDNVFRIGGRLLPVEVKLNVELESNLEGQCEQYCKLDKLILDKKGRLARMQELIDDKILVIDTYAVYMYYHTNNKICLLYDLSDVKNEDNIKELRNIIIERLMTKS